jgi:hypothetical protein
MALIILGLAGVAAIVALVGVILLTIAIGVCIAILLVKAYQSKCIHLLIFMLPCFRAVASSR